MGIIRAGTVFFLAVWAADAHASIPKEMIGMWRWDAATIDVRECQTDRLCATVVAGPTSVGMEVFASALTSKGDDWFAQVVDPNTKESYYTRFRRINPNTWQLDGCTAAGVCLSGEFVRVK